MKTGEKGLALIALILKLADRRVGFSVGAVKGSGESKNAQKKCQLLTADGTLLRVKSAKKSTCYFTSRANADAYIAENGGDYFPAVLHNSGGVRKSRPSKKKPGVGKKFWNGPVPMPAPKPEPEIAKPSVKIITPPTAKYISRPFVDHRAVSVKRMRIGEPGFAMRIGGDE